MNTTIRNTALAAFLFAAASSAAFAADTVDLSVKGLIKPSACDITFAGGNTIDYGTITANTLSATAATQLPTKFLSTAVTCPSAIKIAVKVIDGRRGTATTNDLGMPNYAAPGKYYGFGGQKLGAYALRLSPYNSIDGTNAARITSYNAGQNWAANMTDMFVTGDGTIIASLSTSGTNAPSAGKTFNFGFDVYAALETTANLPALTSDIALDGQATFSVVYL